MIARGWCSSPSLGHSGQIDKSMKSMSSSTEATLDAEESHPESSFDMTCVVGVICRDFRPPKILEMKDALARCFLSFDVRLELRRPALDEEADFDLESGLKMDTRRPLRFVDSSSESESERTPSKDRGIGFGEGARLGALSSAIRLDTRRMPEAKKSE